MIKKINIKKVIKCLLLILNIIILRKNIYCLINIILNLKPLISFIKFQKELRRNDFFKLMNNKSIALGIYKKNKNVVPKVSIISPIYNRERFISRFLRNIQYQSFSCIEIIMIDDCSKDTSVKLIQKYQKDDGRVLLIKNRKNQGTFKSRNIGIMFAKSKYLILQDPDDLLSKNILSLCYKYAERYGFDIIRFNINKIYEYEKKSFNDLWQSKKEKVFVGPELSTYMFYGSEELRISDYYIYNKFMKKEVVVKALNSLNNFYFNMYINLWEDTLLSFVIYRTANSFCSLKRTGYYYIKNSQSITNNMHKISIKRMRYLFLFLKLVFEMTKNTYFEKDMFNLLFTELNRSFNFGYWLSRIIYYSQFQFYYNIISNFLNCNFISKTNRYLFNSYLTILTNRFIIPKQAKKNNSDNNI
jgi:glycosyltransferase involved in cell wall biosynthesis